MPEPIRSAVVGLGRSGWKNHVGAMAMLPEMFLVTSVADPDDERRQQAERELGCRSFGDLTALLAGDPAVELVAIATPTHAHLANATSAMEHGKMVVCDKPIASTLAEADQMIAAARRTGALLTVFSNYRFECDFLTVRRILASGVLGSLLTLRISAVRCGRRHDWQTLTRLGGGLLRNTGWHLIDQAIVLTGMSRGSAPAIAQVARALSPGDAEDYVKIALKGDGLPMIDIEVSDISPFPQDVWHVTGTRGSLLGSHHELRWAYVCDDELTPLTVAAGPAPGREYRFADVPLRQATWHAPDQRPSPAAAFYRRLHATVRHAAPLAVTVESARLVMELIDVCSPGRQDADHAAAASSPRILSASSRYSASTSSTRPSLASSARPGAGSP